LALAVKLLRRHDLNAEVLVVEQQPGVGGLAASFEYAGVHFDYGSHRLHPSTSPEIIRDISTLLGPDLLIRPRHGRIRMLKHFIKFPLTPVDLAFHLPPSFLLGIGFDAVRKIFRSKSPAQVSFARVLLQELGPTIANNFYFPYARKLWGLEPEALSDIQARRRISATNLTQMVRKALAAKSRPGGKKTRPFFYYPRKGFGQICQALAQEVEHFGGKLRLATAVKEIHLQDRCISGITLAPSNISPNDSDSAITSDCEKISPHFVFSTIPVTTLVNNLKPEPNSEVIDCSNQLQYRAMIFCYLILETDQFTPYDAHYFPGNDTIFSRLSEPKNYSGSRDPHGFTGLCMEIPCFVGDDIWTASDDQISSRVLKDLAQVGLPFCFPLLNMFIRRRHHAYPVYDLNFESRFKIIDDYLLRLPNLVSLGRQGLFAHDNTHHALEMAYAASNCLDSGGHWNPNKWLFYRSQFESHVVED
jgi:protoporphyrinogen oxidase